jgi:hypothetical protein
MRYLRRWNDLLVALTAVSLTSVAACSRSAQNDNFSQVASESAFDPKPADVTTIEAQLKRFKGQTRFLNPSESSWNNHYRATADAAAGPGNSRDIQESDIFKIGPDGSKLLYLLNNYRGLQVISYENGPDAPVIKGRVAATGNWPDDMYFDQSHNRLLVLENIYFTADMDYYDYSSQQSRLLIYDVSQPENPKIAQTLELQGRIRESRMVGDVLYVATSVRPSYADDQRGESGSGQVYSFSLTGSSVQQVDTLTLSAPVNYGETMNVIETTENGLKKYYLVAVLSDYSSWSWFGKKPLEIVDISDAQGHIKPMLVVESRGSVSERSQTTVKDGALIVTSNYLAGENRLRIAVESFLLPTADAAVIDANEADYRRMSIDRAAKKLRTQLEAQGLPADEIDIKVNALIEQLKASGDLQLKGVFVKKDGKDTLSKLTPDDAITFGSSQQLSAQLQDVRYDGNLLYAFWVPANNIDPLDVIDISRPTELAHLSHLEFDGWIQRAIPLTYKDKQYIAGLGWIIPPVGDDQRRFPQAVLFEITSGADQSVAAKVVAQKNLSNSSVWANFNATDKNIEFRRTGNDTAMIMYAFSSWTADSYTNGGQLIEIDLASIDTAPSSVFKVGGILKGDEGWLRRIFTNPEIDRVNTFSDMALGTFDVAGGLGSSDQFIEAANVLELARNISDYITFERNGAKFGVQVIGSDRWWSRNSEHETELRLVNAGNADAEKQDTLKTIDLVGTYVDAVVEKNDRLVVLTKKWLQPADDSEWKLELNIFEVSLKQAPQVLEITAKASLGQFPNSYFHSDEQIRNLLKLSNGSIIASYADKAFIVGAADGQQLQLSEIQLGHCLTAEPKGVHFHEFDGRIWTHFIEKVQDPERANYSYDRHLVAEVSTDGSTCANPVNIPGIPLRISQDGLIVTQDNRLIDIIRHGDDRYSYYETKTDNVLGSLRYQPAASTGALADIYDASDTEISSLVAVESGHLMFVESSQKPSYWFDRHSDIAIWPGRSYGSVRENRLAVIGFDDELNFTKRSFNLNLDSSQHVTLGKVVTAGDDLIAVTKQGSSYAVWKLDENWILSKKRLRPLGDNVSVEKAAVPGWYYGDLDRSINVADEGRSLLLINGYFGISQYQITD